MQTAIAYYRVSTERQGRSGLGLEAQQKAVGSFLEANDFVLIDEFIEVNSGNRNHNYGLKNALRECKKRNAVLVIAKLDRLSRSVAFISTLMESDVDFRIVDNPYAEDFTLHILAAVAEKERKDISKRTTAALAAAKLRGVELGKHGRYVLSNVNRFYAIMFASKMRRIIEGLKSEGFNTVRELSNELNRRRIKTPQKKRWHPSTVYKLVKRINDLNGQEQ